MKERGLFEDNLDHVFRMLEILGKEKAASSADVALRADDRELEPSVQAAVSERMKKLEAGTVLDAEYFKGLRGAFLNLFGFEIPQIDYSAPVDTLFGHVWPQ
jgi:enoyl-[acyl-carrier protein] reductase/trans-2-enoyl-CoA reductase (NAD+)